ncbi:SH2 domain-containing protein 4A [Tiliqua scincoides]|uniref:SH2 domain-containing protein 4A n=1 Tax=Tiliqua scincoides TaxID=71010 RepID=UPI0034628DEC
MLKQILSEMYVDPELLAELSEEQKQILFFKMRQEQIRRWKEREAAETLEEAQRKPALKEAHGKSVQWKLGADGDIWVWVMGEHALDKPYELLCAEILAQTVRQQSMKEAATVRRNPAEASTEPSATFSLNFPSDVQCGSEIQLGSKNTKKWDVQKGVKTAPAAENARSQECNQLSVKKSRGVEQMLADSINQSRKPGFHQRKEVVLRTTTNESRPQGETVPDHNTDSMQKLEKEDSEWLETLQRSKVADERRRSLARHARDDYKRLSLQGAHKGKVAEASKASKTRGHRQLVPPPLPPKPKNLTAGIANGQADRKRAVQRSVSSSTQESIIRWFKEEQLHLRAGFEKSTDAIAPWFHGLITTKKAEELLTGSVPGSFLIRVSEKIKGYVLSYSSAEGCKHFLIDASGDSYSFLGVDQLQHSMLADLVDYHKDEPITSLGKERLRYPCGQQDLEPDYLELFE